MFLQRIFFESISLNDLTIDSVDELKPAEIEKKASLIKEYLQTLPQKALNLGVRIFLALIFFIIGIWVIKGIRKVLKHSLERGKVDVGVQQFLDSLVKSILMVVLVLLIASGFGLDATSVVALVGSAGVAIGLALQGSLSNLAGGVLILILKPFKVGDFIKEDSKGNEGTVTQIQIFYTKLLTPDGKTVILPNGNLANNSIVNYSSAAFRRLDVYVGISYDSDIKKAKELIIQLIKDNELILKNRDIVVDVDELGDNSVVLLTKCYVSTGSYWVARDQLLEGIKTTFDANGIGIPYPQMDVHMK